LSGVIDERLAVPGGARPPHEFGVQPFDNRSGAPRTGEGDR
jgi:hypothetical protein